MQTMRRTARRSWLFCSGCRSQRRSTPQAIGEGTSGPRIFSRRVRHDLGVGQDGSARVRVTALRCRVTVTAYSTPQFSALARAVWDVDRGLWLRREAEEAAEPSGRPMSRPPAALTAPRSLRLDKMGAAGATLKERRDAHDAVVGPARSAGTLDQRQSPPVRQAATAPDSPPGSAPRHQVLLVHRHRAEPRLEQVAGYPEARVDRRRVAPMRLAERAPERLRAVGDENEVNVVGHQTIGPDRDALFAALGRQEIAIERIVVVAKEDALAPVAALRDVMGKAGKDELGDAGHFGSSGDMVAMNLRNLNWGLSKVSPEFV